MTADNSINERFDRQRCRILIVEVTHLNNAINAKRCLTNVGISVRTVDGSIILHTISIRLLGYIYYHTLK